MSALTRLPLVLGTVLIAAACGRSIDLSQYATPETLYDAALAAYRTGNCGEAQLMFEGLQTQLPPRDQRQAEARYYLAECTLRRGERIDAARQFRRIADEFPQHPLAPDGLLRAGDAYAELWRTPQLDPTYGETAYATYTELIGRFPGTPAAARAQLRIAELNDGFAEKDYRNGVFYLRLRAFDSAIIYFKDVVARYPASAFAAPSVLRLIEAYDRIGYEEERDEMCAYLRQYYQAAVPETDRCGGGAGGR